MAQLEIYIAVEGDNTVSQYYTPKTKHVTFYNKADSVATIKVKDPVGVPVLCEKQNDDTTTKAEFAVPAQVNNKPGSVKMFVCRSYEGETFKYSAQVEGKNTEDPIILVGKDMAGPGSTLSLVDFGLGLLGGIALTLLALRLFRKQRPA